MAESSPFGVSQRRTRCAHCFHARPFATARITSTCIYVVMVAVLLQLTAIPTAFAFHAGGSDRRSCSVSINTSTRTNTNTNTRLSVQESPARLRLQLQLQQRLQQRLVELQMVADNEENGGENPSSISSSSSSSSARKTQSLTSPVRKTDRRSPTRIIAKPSANARSTMALGGDKIAKKKTTATTTSTTTTTTTRSDDESTTSAVSPTASGGFLGGSYSFEDFKLPFSQTSVQLENGLKNDGPFAWMAPYVDLFGYRTGKSLVGAIPTDPQASPDYDTLKLSQEEISERRAAAERDLTNISPEEKERRAEVAQVALKVCGAYAIFSSLILDDGGIGGHAARFAVILPLFAWRGYDLSAKEGL